MSRLRPPAIAVAAVAAILLAAYGAIWAGVSTANIASSDFTAVYVSGSLLREGHAAGIYDQALQGPMAAAVIAPLKRANLPFVYPPVAAALVAPLTLLPLAAAYRLWQAAQLLMLVLAVLIAVRFAPWPAGLRRRGPMAVTSLAALAGTGTLALGLLGQWDGLSALGLAAAYALWRRDNRLAGGLVLAASAMVAKPHLAIGLAAMLLGWRDRRVLAGATLGAAAVALLSLLLVGPQGLAGLVTAVRGDSGLFPTASMLGLTGLSASWLGDGTAATLLGSAAAVAALGACLLLGRALRYRSALEPCLAAATLLSLLASPHLLSHDLVILAPVLVSLVAWAALRDGIAPWPGPLGRRVLLGWGVLSLAAAFDLGAQRAGPPGRLVPVALLVLAALLTWQLRPNRRVFAAAAS